MPKTLPKCTSCGNVERLDLALATTVALNAVAACHCARFWAFIQQNGRLGSANRHFRPVGLRKVILSQSCVVASASIVVNTRSMCPARAPGPRADPPLDRRGDHVQ